MHRQEYDRPLREDDLRPPCSSLYVEGPSGCPRVEDYGVYNVVGGVVTMLGFFNGAMVSSTQRFFSFAIGQEDVEQLNRNYSPLLRDEVQQGLYDPDGHSSQPLHRICGRSLEDHLASSDVQTQGIYLPFRNLSRPVGEGKVRLVPRLLLPT